MSFWDVCVGGGGGGVEWEASAYFIRSNMHCKFDVIPLDGFEEMESKCCTHKDT